MYLILVNSLLEKTNQKRKKHMVHCESMAISKSKLKKLFGRDKYEVEVFSQNGFDRRRCEKCGTMFWTVNPDQKTCGDTPCVGGYTFIGKEAGNWDFHETIRRMNSFFERNGHTIIDEYPVVARWRDDIDFTIASIADFQPWVLSGVIDPPANPLGVPQPCVRFGGEDFNDLDNIGRTGRHLSAFVMYGQHAFNSERTKDGYWMDECLRLNLDFLTSELGLPMEEITYHEGIWMGGGNFGPNLEAFARGSELVNNVFMQYETTPSGGHREMDMTVIDVGWGVERTSWFTQGSPTIYEATLGPVLEHMKGSAGIDIDEELLGKYAILAGLLNVDEVENIDVARIGVAKKLGISAQAMENLLAPLEALYGIADHTRTLVFTIADGAIPSNVGGGYNLRTLLRRALTLDKIHGFGFDFSELFNLQIDYIKKTYARVERARESIDTIFNLERKRLETTLTKGRKFVKNMLSSGKEMDTPRFVELYQSRGMSPEMIQDIAKEMDIHISVPGDFYTMLDTFKQKNAVAAKGDDKDVEVNGIDESAGTITLFYENTYAFEMEATVVAVSDDKKHIQLDRTVFYPSGGGQAGDTGELTAGNKLLKVENTIKKGKAILHVLAKSASGIAVGARIVGRIDSARRMALMRHHTGTHVLNGAAKLVLGNHVWQEGADKTPEKARLDISHFKRVTVDELEQIEREANRVVFENRLVTTVEIPRGEAEAEHGFSIYQGGIVPGAKLRLVTVENWDVEACGGTHLNRTGEIGPIKILAAERIQDGVVRLEFKAGMPAVEAIQQQERSLQAAAEITQTSKEGLESKVASMVSEWKQQRKTITRLQKVIAELKSAHVEEFFVEVTGSKVLITENSGTFKEAAAFAENIVNRYPNSAVLIGIRGPPVVFAGTVGSESNLELNTAVSKASQVVGGGGGGKGKLSKGGGPDSSKFDDAMRVARETLGIK